MRICDRRSFLALLAAATLAPLPVLARDPAVVLLAGHPRPRSRRRLLKAVTDAENRFLALDITFVDGELGEIVDVDPVDDIAARDVRIFVDDDPSGRSHAVHLTFVGGWSEAGPEKTAVRGLFEVRLTELRRAYAYYRLTRISDDPRPPTPKRVFVKTDLK